MATCFCNDIYREAEKRNIWVSGVEVVVEGEFLSEGGVASNVFYRAMEVKASDKVLADLIEHTDKVTEIQNTLRAGINVSLKPQD